jgi:hypothetical protein
MPRLPVQKKIALEMLEDARGWEKGYTKAALAVEIYGADTLATRQRVSNLIHGVRKTFLKRGDYLVSKCDTTVDGTPEYRYCLANTSDDALEYSNMVLVVQIGGNVRSFKDAETYISKNVPENLRIGLAHRAFEMAQVLALPPKPEEKKDDTAQD